MGAGAGGGGGEGGRWGGGNGGRRERAQLSPSGHLLPPTLPPPARPPGPITAHAWRARGWRVGGGRVGPERPGRLEVGPDTAFPHALAPEEVRAATRGSSTGQKGRALTNTTGVQRGPNTGQIRV